MEGEWTLQQTVLVHTCGVQLLVYLAFRCWYLVGKLHYSDMCYSDTIALRMPTMYELILLQQQVRN